MKASVAKLKKSMSPSITASSRSTNDRPAAAKPRRWRLRRWLLRFWRDTGARTVGGITTDVIPGGSERYLDPAVIARFSLTPLLTRRIVEGFLSGLHRSPFRGFSVEFADHREYVPGDDLKFIDWRLYARTDHYYVKRSEEETNVRCFLLLDRSASMAFGTEGLTKWDYGCFLSSALAYLMLKQQDAVGLALFGAEPGIMVPPRCRSRHLHELMRVMVTNPPSGTTALAASLQKIARQLKRRSLVVLVSDLIDAPEETVKAIRLLRSQKHDVVVFHLQDPAEINFDFEGAAVFRDVETGEEMEVDPVAMRGFYLENMANLQDFLIKQLREAGVDYEPINTTQPYDKALLAYLQRRSAMRG